MKMMLIALICATVFATPCIYDATSQEPSPLAGAIAVTLR